MSWTDVVAFGQHNGLPTRFLDWSEGSSLALFFAVRRPRDFVGKDAVVWMLSPEGLNLCAGIGRAVFFQDPDQISKFREAYENPLARSLPVGRDAPVAFVPNSVHPRIVSQRGAFTIAGDDPLWLETQGAERHNTPEEFLHAFVIPAGDVARVAEELDVAGVNASTVYPDIGGLAAEIAYRHLR